MTDPAVVRGAVEVLAQKEGRERRVGIAGPGELIGYLAALEGAAHGASARVRESAALLEFPRDVFLDTRRFSTDRHFDVREVLTNYDRYRKGTLEFFCEIFRVPSPKNGINGSNVGDYFKAGRLDQIAQYCLADCKATGELYLKLRNYYR